MEMNSSGVGSFRAFGIKRAGFTSRDCFNASATGQAISSHPEFRTVHGGRPRTRAVVVHACKAPKVSWLAKILEDRKQARGDMHMS